MLRTARQKQEVHIFQRINAQTGFIIRTGTQIPNSPIGVRRIEADFQELINGLTEDPLIETIGPERCARKLALKVVRSKVHTIQGANEGVISLTTVQETTCTRTQASPYAGWLAHHQNVITPSAIGKATVVHSDAVGKFCAFNLSDVDQGIHAALTVSGGSCNQVHHNALGCAGETHHIAVAAAIQNVVTRAAVQRIPAAQTGD